MKAGLRTYILADANITALLYSATSCYSFPAPQDATRPYLMLSRISSVIQNLIGSSLDIYNETWQVDVMAATDLSAEAIKEKIISRLNIADRVAMGSYTVYSCSLTGVTDNSDLEMTGSETPVFRKTLEFEMIRDRTN